jgi:DNA primase
MHYKRKMEINLDTGQYHCWVCNERGGNLRSLFRKIKASEKHRQELFQIIGNGYYIHSSTKTEVSSLQLPEGFTPLSRSQKSIEYCNAIKYLKSRGITKDDILRYNIGYCEVGKFKQRVVIPSYDKDGNLNFFSSRTYYPSVLHRYMNPAWDKNIVGFEMMINWDLPVTITEGVFDAIAIRQNAIPLFGTLVSMELKRQIMLNGVERLNIVLDNDAMKHALEHYEFFDNQGVQVHLIKLDNQDPSMLGFDQINEIIHDSTKFEFSDFISLKMGL